MRRLAPKRLAQLNGVQLGEVLTVSEVIGGSAYPMDRDAEGLGAAAALRCSPANWK